MENKDSTFLPLGFELAKELKEAGYSQYGKSWWVLENYETEWKEVNEDTHLNIYELGKRLQDFAYLPTLSELIKACRDDDPLNDFKLIMKGYYTEWHAHYGVRYGLGASPEQAVARLWIALKKGTS